MLQIALLFATWNVANDGAPAEVAVEPSPALLGRSVSDGVCGDVARAALLPVYRHFVSDEEDFVPPIPLSPGHPDKFAPRCLAPATHQIHARTIRQEANLNFTTQELSAPGAVSIRHDFLRRVRHELEGGV
jgi:hypothetical protein